MMYSLVTKEGNIVGAPRVFTDPPNLAAVKGRWLPDIMPTYDANVSILTRKELVEPDDDAIQYIITTRPIDEVKTQSLDMVDTVRMQEDAEGFVFRDKVLSTTVMSKQDIIISALAAVIQVIREGDYGVEWGALDGTSLELDADGMMDLLIALSLHTSTSRVSAQARRKSIEEAETSSIAWEELTKPNSSDDAS